MSLIKNFNGEKLQNDIIDMLKKDYILFLMFALFPILPPIFIYICSYKLITAKDNLVRKIFLVFILNASFIILGATTALIYFITVGSK